MTSVGHSTPGEELGRSPFDLEGMGKLVTATVVGNTIEYYDFNVYGTLTALVFAQLFFPVGDPFIATLLAFGAFAVGFVSRPLGGLIFGVLGDRLGRKPMLMWSLGVMGGATALMGCLPTYDQAGIIAPILLVTLRLFQGFGIGGEWGGAVTLMIEHSPRKRRGFFGSLVQTGSGLGIILASLTLVILLGVLDKSQLLAWGWRIPFLLSAVLVLIGGYIRLHIEESPEFEKLQAEQAGDKSAKRTSTLAGFTRFPRTILLAVGMYASVAAVGFMCGVFVVNYAVNALGFGQQIAVTASLVGVVGYLIFIPIGGLVSDRFDRAKCYMAGAAAMIVGVGILFLLPPLKSVPLFFVGMFVAQATNGFIFGIQAALFASLFPPEVRYTGISLGMQIGTVLGGGLMPTVSAILVAAGGGTTVLLFGYVSALCVLTIVCTALVGRVKEWVPSDAEVRS